jgi:V-type H+-transporting ATPase 16kDa proteolipid subunit
MVSSIQVLFQRLKQSINQENPRICKYYITVTVENYTPFMGFAHMGAGLSVGLAGLSAGISVGIVGDCGVRSVAQQPKVFVGMILMLIFSEALGLYGLIIGLIVQGKT